MYTDEVPFVWSSSTLSKPSCMCVYVCVHICQSLCVCALCVCVRACPCFPLLPSVKLTPLKTRCGEETGNKLKGKHNLFEASGSWLKLLPVIKYVSSPPPNSRMSFLWQHFASAVWPLALWQDNTKAFSGLRHYFSCRMLIWMRQVTGTAEKSLDICTHVDGFQKQKSDAIHCNC